MSIDRITLGVLANRMDSITREMTNTMVRTARSTTMAAKDFSCSIVSSEDEMVSAPEGIPVHVYGSAMMATDMREAHPDFREGDCFMSNDPYGGNSHAADQTLLVPVFFEGEHVFTAVAKAHQADIGNAKPTTYSPTALDVYNEGALIFPCVKVQSHYSDVTDIIRMCERRIRAFDTWYGDYLATLGAVRLAERRLKELCEAYGLATIRAFVTEWLNYSEQMAADAIATLPAGRMTTKTALDPFPRLPDGIPLQATVDVFPDRGHVVVDLRDNPDCTPTGLNLTESTSKNSATTAILMVLNSHPDLKAPKVPNNAGTYRRIEVLVRENCVIGKPRHPASASVATNTVADRVVGMILHGMAKMQDGIGAAHPCFGQPPWTGVVSGFDARRDGDEFVAQLFCGTSGGPATAHNDGYLQFTNTGGAGLEYIDSSEICEQKYPLVVWEKMVRTDSEGAGRLRGAPGGVAIYGPRFGDVEVQYFLDAVVNRSLGVQGGSVSRGPEAYVARAAGPWDPQNDSAVGEVPVAVGEAMVSLSGAGAGYGSALTRDPAKVLTDVIDDYVTIGRAREAYGVVITGDPSRWETLAVDLEATAALRASRSPEPLPWDDDDATRNGREHESWWLDASLAGVLA
ncbi:MAG: hydantoinase B/oxoprolinase family protein [Solirubrobacteraceae bacterium]|nr:hydantoinase B/oxoprolinase family protein [Solirubrobacteraceae bacterium]